MAESNDQSNDGRAAVLLQVTDTHLHATPDSRMRGVRTHETFLAVLDHVRKDPRWPPDAIVVTGDIVQDESRAGYQRFRETLEVFGLPVLCIPGNHDDPVLMQELLMTPPFQVCGDTGLGEWRIILLSTFEKGEDAGSLGPSGLASLEQALTKYSGEHTLICMHHQPLPMGSAWLDGVGLRDAEAFLATVDRHDHVRGVLWGHVHQASDRERNGVRFLSTPSTCSQFLPDSDFFALDNRPPGLRWLSLQPDGTIDTAVDWIQAVEQK